jgi:molybdenum cofactor cytidylyltransferase
VTSVLLAAGVDPVVVVCGAGEEGIRSALEGFPVKITRNPNYLQGDMLVSLQRGLEVIPEAVEAILVALGDQPQVEKRIIEQVIGRYQENGSALVVPSFGMRRGHPWLMGKQYWAEVLRMGGDLSLRDFLGSHADEIDYVAVESGSILKDLDTPEAYNAEKPD